jgi:hypothetical protein
VRTDLYVLGAIADQMDVHLGLPDAAAARAELAALGTWRGTRQEFPPSGGPGGFGGMESPPRGVWGDGSPQEQGGSGGDRPPGGYSTPTGWPGARTSRRGQAWPRSAPPCAGRTAGSAAPGRPRAAPPAASAGGGNPRRTGGPARPPRPAR